MDSLKAHINRFCFFFSFVILLNSCGPKTILPQLSTTPLSEFTFNSAILGGNITSDGGGAIIERGVCCGTTTNPTIENNRTIDGSGTGIFTSTLTNLISNTTYYARSYATNEAGTAYGNEETFILNMNLLGPDITDITGNQYKTVIIGSQTWMAENLRTTRFNDYTPINLVTESSIWKDYNVSTPIPRYCWYNNDSLTYSSTYGALYNWSVISTGKLCPSGWHVPSSSEWVKLILYLGGTSTAGSKAKESGTIRWDSPNSGATNESGFSGLPGGKRHWQGNFEDIGKYGFWWNSSDYISDAGYNYLSSSSTSFGNSYWFKWYGLSVRCIKDN